MTTDPEDDEGQSRLTPEFLGLSALGSDRLGVEHLASEVLNLVARRAVEVRRAKDRTAVMATALALTSGSESEASVALESLDDNLKGLDWFLEERLGPIAKQIGNLWNEDKISFLEATVGATRIYSYIRYRRRPTLPTKRANRRAATFVLVPGDMHTLGISAATDVFRSRGWDITLLVGYKHEDLVAHFESATDQLYGFSAGTALSMGALGRLAVALTVSHPTAHVIVSGQIACDRDAVMRLPGVYACDPDLEGAYLWLDAQNV
jgi:methanogenic corrinoid protein MtbC1